MCVCVCVFFVFLKTWNIISQKKKQKKKKKRKGKLEISINFKISNLGPVWIFFFHHSLLLTQFSSLNFSHSSLITHYSLLKILQFSIPTRLAHVFNFSSLNFFYCLWDPLLDSYLVISKEVISVRSLDQFWWGFFPQGI